MHSVILLGLLILGAFAHPLQAISGKIHVFGDSHTYEFSGIPNVELHWLGAITMHRVGRDGFGCLFLPDHDVKLGEVAVFCFGEIDVRYHIGRQRDLENRETDQIIDTLVSDYFDTILLNRLCYQDLTCIVYSVTPPRNVPNFVFYGKLKDRINLTKQLNAKLAEACKQANMLFLDVYDAYANPDGSLNEALSDGSVHINHLKNKIIRKRLYDLLQR